MKQHHSSRFARVGIVAEMLFIILSILSLSSRAFGQEAITYGEGSRIYNFIVDKVTHHLYVNSWDGSQWSWTDHGTPPGTMAASRPGVIGYQEFDSTGQPTQTQRIYAFLRGADGHTYANYGDGSQTWTDLGTP